MAPSTKLMRVVRSDCPREPTLLVGLLAYTGIHTGELRSDATVGSRTALRPSDSLKAVTQIAQGKLATERLLISEPSGLSNHPLAPLSGHTTTAHSALRADAACFRRVRWLPAAGCDRVGRPGWQARGATRVHRYAGSRSV